MFEELIVWIGVLGTIVIIIVILDLCMVGAHSSVSYWSGCSIFSIICDMISTFSVSEIDKNPCLWAIRGSAFHRQHFIMKFSTSWSAVINVFKWSFLPFINMTLETYKSCYVKLRYLQNVIIPRELVVFHCFCLVFVSFCYVMLSYPDIDCVLLQMYVCSVSLLMGCSAHFVWGASKIIMKCLKVH